MKGDEKHRLEENELQRLVEKTREKAKPFMEQYGNSVLLAASAGVLILAIVFYIMRDQAGEKSKGWDPLGNSLLTSGASTAKLENLGEQQADTVPGLIAKVQAAQQRINQGMQYSFSKTSGACRRLGSEKLCNRRAPHIEIQQHPTNFWLTAKSGNQVTCGRCFA